MNDELIERLKSPRSGNTLLCREAALHIEAQQREIEEFRQECKRLIHEAAYEKQAKETSLKRQIIYEEENTLLERQLDECEAALRDLWDDPPNWEYCDADHAWLARHPEHREIIERITQEG